MRIFTLFISFIIVFTAAARSFEVLSFSPTERDLQARVNGVRDLNGKLCPLIKVFLPKEDCKFEGNVVRQEYDINEYKVYMTPGTKILQLRYPNYETLRIDLTRYVGLEGLIEGTTYELKLSGIEENSQSSDIAKGNFLVIGVSPKTNAFVKVDNDVLQLEDGKASTFLPYGTHQVSVEAPGYMPEIRTVEIGSAGASNISVQLKSVMAKLNVSTTTEGASIILNGKTRSTNSRFSGELAAGTYLVEIEKSGFKKYSQTVTLSQNENKELSIGPLDALYGALKVDVKPIGSKIVIDGKEAGVSPLVINNLTAGKHTVKVSNDGYKDYTATVDISEENLVSLNTNLTPIPVNTQANQKNPHEYAPGKIKVEGHVYEGRGKGDPLIGCTIALENTSMGTAADIDGYFCLYVYPGDTLIFRYVGKKTKKIKITDQKHLEVHM